MEALRKAFETKFPDPQQFDAADVRRLSTDDSLANAFLSANEDNVDEALQQVEKSFAFRQEMSLNTLTDASFPLEMRQKGSVFYHSQDKKGNKILYFRIRDNVKKEAAVVALGKQYVAYLIDQEHRKDASQQLVMLFDMTGAGLSNFDPDLVRYIITCFDTYFPNFLAYLLVYDMPFILNAAWKLIRNWLSERAREKVIFVKRSSVTEYIAREQLWSHMGGMVQNHFDRDDYEYSYESPQDEMDAGFDHSTLEESMECRNRKTSRISDDSVSHSLTSSANHQAPSSSPHRLLSITPADHLHFPKGVDSRPLALRSAHSTPLAFKVNTTRPQDFRVRPSSGLLPPHERAEVTVTLKAAPATLAQAASARFQILALPVGADLSKEAALAQLKSAGRESLFETRLGCLMGNKPAPEPDLSLGAVAKQVGEVERRQKAEAAKMEDLVASVRMLCYMVAAVLLLQLLMLLRPSPTCRN